MEHKQQILSAGLEDKDRAPTSALRMARFILVHGCSVLSLTSFLIAIVWRSLGGGFVDCMGEPQFWNKVGLVNVAACLLLIGWSIAVMVSLDRRRGVISLILLAIEMAAFVTAPMGSC